MRTDARFEACVVGTGRVGLPLALSLLDAGVRVVGHDLDASVRDAVRAGRMPFQEPGYESVLARRELEIRLDAAVVAEAKAIIVTVGTPLHAHIETDLSQLRGVLEAIRPHLRAGHLICLRSTIAPGTARYVARWLEGRTSMRVGEDILLAVCPERIAEGRAYEELRTLPQVIGADDEASAAAAAALWGRIAPELLPTDTASAELVKLFNNVARYVRFALANQFAMVAEAHGASIHEVRRLTNHRYPRETLAAPGFTAGPCLRKDFGMLSEFCPYSDLLLSAWRMNESMPAFLVRCAKERTELHGKRIAVLGFAFKRDSDDARDSLVPKLIRYIEREFPEEIRVSDEHFASNLEDPLLGPIRNWPASEALADADVVFVAMNHSAYAERLQKLGRARPTCWVVDLWDRGGIARCFYRAGDLIRDRPPSSALR